MRAINESELDIAKDKLESIRTMASSFLNSDDQLLVVVVKAILEVINE